MLLDTTGSIGIDTLHTNGTDANFIGHSLMESALHESLALSPHSTRRKKSPATVTILNKNNINNNNNQGEHPGLYFRAVTSTGLVEILILFSFFLVLLIYYIF